MRLTVFGATGGTGRRLVDLALAAGHEVTAAVREPARLPERAPAAPAPHPVRCDVLDREQVAAAVAGADAVLSALGATDGGPVCGTGVPHIIAAMKAHGVRRLVALSAAPVPDRDPGDRPLYRLTVRPILRALFSAAYADLAVMEGEIFTSGLDWTVLRPPRLTDGPATGAYRTALRRNVPGGYAISRADLAAEMLRVLDDSAAVRATVGIGY
ncbi:NAD(P)-dependent oxidoreductase [Allonocardiopsis opalescens]|uniref:Putative NADH-flavin reductase n=1 Tax=Allonocardiopsis opalescens TaxID=1144618 RepID=A0A2T0QAN5_9ACTN|nr:NAD(P)H-binding protein [Allonocardiopsis opalescens]PRY00885.1 putative NADH-flavin reductase [Allonocardiopsis opalescens]